MRMATAASPNHQASHAVRFGRARRERRGDQGRRAHHDAAPSGHRRELAGARHRVADEAQVVRRVRVQRLGLVHEGLYTTENRGSRGARGSRGY